MPAAMEASVGPVATAVALVAVQTLGCVEEVKVDAAVKGVAVKGDMRVALVAAMVASRELGALGGTEGGMGAAGAGCWVVEMVGHGHHT